MALSAKKEHFTEREIAEAEDLTSEAELVGDEQEPGEVIELTQAMRKDGGEKTGDVILLTPEMKKKLEQPEHIRQALGKLREMSMERRAHADKAMRNAQPLLSPDKELKPGDVLELKVLTREELEKETISARRMDEQIDRVGREMTEYLSFSEQERKHFTDQELKFFAEGEAVRKIGGEEVRLLEMRENLGLEPKELEKIEEVFATAPKREVRDMSKSFADALEKNLLEGTPEYREATELAEKLAKMEEKFEDYYIDIDKGKVSQLANVKNRLLIGIHRTLNKPFRKEHDEYKRLQTRFEARLKDLENLGIFAGKSRAGRALDARLRAVMDSYLFRGRGVRGG